MKEPQSRLMTLSQYLNKWQGSGVLKIDPTHISYIEHVREYQNDDEYHGHSKIHTIFGQIVEVGESPAVIEDIMTDWYEERDKNDNGKLVISKDDIVKNFILRNLSANP